MKRFFPLLLAFSLLISCKDEHANLPDGLYAEIETAKGTLIAALEFEKTPITVANFVTLAEGKNTFVIEQMKGKPFFDGLKFHRVIPEFMIQGGDPLGTGSGDTGYRFRDEITDLRHDKPGILSMANSGPGTNSSQFFITHVPTPWLDGKHTVFGHVVENGMGTVNKIVQDDAIVSIKIIRKGDAAKKFDAVKIFTDFFQNEAENQKKEAAAAAENKKIYDAKFKVVREQKMAYFESARKDASTTRSGLMYKIIKKGGKQKPAPGSAIFIHYSGYLENGGLFDSSVESVAREFGKFDQRRADAKQYIPIPFQIGRKDGMIPGFIEGIEQMSIGDKAIVFIPANLAYGAQGAGNVIPPNANIIFELELFDTMPQ